MKMNVQECKGFGITIKSVIDVLFSESDFKQRLWTDRILHKLLKIIVPLSLGHILLYARPAKKHALPILLKIPPQVPLHHIIILTREMPKQPTILLLPVLQIVLMILLRLGHYLFGEMHDFVPDDAFVEDEVGGQGLEQGYGLVGLEGLGEGLEAVGQVLGEDLERLFQYAGFVVEAVDVLEEAAVVLYLLDLVVVDLVLLLFVLFVSFGLFLFQEHN